MQLRLGDVAGFTGRAYDLSTRHAIAALDVDPLGMRVSRDIAIVVLDQNEIAVTSQLVADIGDGAGVRGMYRRSELRGNIDAVIASSADGLAKGRDDAAVHRPKKFLLGIG